MVILYQYLWYDNLYECCSFLYYTGSTVVNQDCRAGSIVTGTARDRSSSQYSSHVKCTCISHLIAQFIRAAKSGKTADLSALSQALTERGVDINECKDASHVRLAVVNWIDSVLLIIFVLNLLWNLPVAVKCLNFLSVARCNHHQTFNVSWICLAVSL